ncbi:hypothetical protein ANCCAN_24449 [Ancylostoma caninum]|uniref:Uncharacterized protein n=1 Tax=Ancylostoma caninum TaxID=29170 RepID=A0A368FDX1_ANCCA|nr:hypothetical protein ANCCAN_24449 [Ancylostoma caninum]
MSIWNDFGFYMCKVVAVPAQGLWVACLVTAIGSLAIYSALFEATTFLANYADYAENASEMSTSSRRKAKEAERESAERIRKRKSKQRAETRSRKSTKKGEAKPRSRKTRSQKKEITESYIQESHAKSGSSEDVVKTMETQILGSQEKATQSRASLDRVEKTQSREPRESAGLRQQHSSLYSGATDNSTSL